MEASNGKRLKMATRKSAACIATLLLFALSCFIWGFLPSKEKSQRDGSRIIEDIRSTEAAACADNDTKDEMSGDDTDTPIQPLSASEQAELITAVSNIVSAYSNRDAKVVCELTATTLDSMTSRKRQITAEVGARIIEPIQRALNTHFNNYDRFDVFRNSKTAGELDVCLELEMQLVSFACAINMECGVGDISIGFEGLPLRAINRRRNTYVSDSRDDMVVVCDKWIARWQEHIDSEKGYFRYFVRKSYLRNLQFETARAGCDGVFSTKEGVKQHAYQNVRDFGYMFGYTPKWIKEYEPQEAQSDRDSRAPDTAGAK